jgi:hypothetical protein
MTNGVLTKATIRFPFISTQLENYEERSRGIIKRMEEKHRLQCSDQELTQSLTPTKTRLPQLPVKHDHTPIHPHHRQYWFITLHGIRTIFAIHQ